jgi:CDP-4-dehydro-6-deoxyglucose reductase
MDILQKQQSLRERAEAVPLITESARTVDFRVLDEDRTREVREAMADLLEAHDLHHLVEDGEPRTIDWETLETIRDNGKAPDSERFRRLYARYHREYPSLVNIELDPNEEAVDFVPGQFLSIRFCGTPRPYSIASSPNYDLLRFCIRRVPGGRLTPQICDCLCPGEEVTIRGPNGDFTLKEPSERDVAFLATGTGVAPFRSMIDYIFEEGRDVYEGQERDVWLFLGASWRDDLGYHEHFQQLDADHENFHYVPTLSREHYLTDWSGESDYVQRTLLHYVTDDVEPAPGSGLQGALDAEPKTDVRARIDPSNLELYACGLNMMVNTVDETARAIGVDPRHIDVEGYG